MELAYRAYEAFNRRDLGALLTLMDDDVEDQPREGLMEGSYRGHDGIRLIWERMLGVFPDGNVEVVEVRDLGDLTVGVRHVRGHGAGSNVPAEDNVWQVARWRDGKCVWWRNFDTRDEALQAVGLSEQDAHADS